MLSLKDLHLRSCPFKSPGRRREVVLRKMLIQRVVIYVLQSTSIAAGSICCPSAVRTCSMRRFAQSVRRTNTSTARRQKQHATSRAPRMLSRTVAFVLRLPSFPLLPSHSLRMGMAFTDRDVLRALFRSAGGPSWTRKEYWDTDAELSQWYGVEVDDQDRVVKLDLRHNNLEGAIHTFGRVHAPRCTLVMHTSLYFVRTNDAIVTHPPDRR